MKTKIDTPISMSEADTLIGDTYLAKGEINKAKEIYKKVVAEYGNKPSGWRGHVSVAKKQLQQLDNGEKIIGMDSVVYEIKDGKVEVSLI